VTFAPWCGPDPAPAEWVEAAAALEPHAHDLRRAITAAWADYFEPVKIRVPLWFPQSVDGSLLWRVPVERADVQEPEIVVRDHLEQTWWVRWPA